MKKFFSKIVIFLLSVSFFGMWGVYVYNKNFYYALIMLLFGCMTNPFIHKFIEKRLSIEELDYSYMLKIIFIFFGTVIAYIIAILIFNNTGIKKEADTLINFASIFKICVYLLYFLILVFTKSSDRFLKYIIFGIIYLVCAIFSFSSHAIDERVINILNWMLRDNIDLETYDILFNAFLTPIKEAILTYIIFDTVYEQKSKGKNYGGKEMNRKQKCDRKLSYLPYGFDFKYELKTYKNIGVNYKINLLSNSNPFYYVRNKIRHVYNVHDKKYKNFDTYSEWKKYIIDKQSTDGCNYSDFKRYLLGNLREYEFQTNLISNILGPIQIAVGSGGLSIFLLIDDNIGIINKTFVVCTCFGFIMIFVLALLTRQSEKIYKKFYFFKDYIEVIDEKEKLMCKDEQYKI